MPDFTTKDSGERAEFDSGMKRDTEAGKPRFDLLRPLNVPYEEQFLTRVAALLGRGAEKYDERNWEKADSEAELARMKSSAARHFEQWLNGETDEDHAAATVFNLLAHETTAYKMAAARKDSWYPPESHVFLCGIEPDPIEVEWGNPAPVTLDSKFDSFATAQDLQPFIDVINADVKRISKAFMQAAELELIEEFDLYEVAFISTTDGDVHDIRQAVHNALNRRD